MPSPDDGHLVDGGMGADDLLQLAGEMLLPPEMIMSFLRSVM